MAGPATRSSSVVAFYLRSLRTALQTPRRLATFAFAAASHAASHALVALVAAGIALCLAEQIGLRTPPSAPGPGARIVPFGGPLADRALILSLLGLGVILVKGVSGTYATFVQARAAGQVGSALRLDLLDAMLAIHRLQRPRHRDHGSPPLTQPAGAVVALTDRVRDVEAGLEQGLLGGARAVAQLVPICALLVALSSRMAAVAAIVLGAFGWVLGRVRAGYRRATQRATRHREALLEAADEAVRHADLWVTYGAEARARATTGSLGEAIADGSARLQARGVALSSANEILGAAALVLAVAASQAGWLGAASSGATLLSFAVAFFLAYRPLRELADARLAIARAQGAYDDLGRVIDGAPATERQAVEAPRTWPLADLELRGVCLARGAARPLSLRIDAGAIVALVGPTGAGKTTLLRTLLGLEASLGGDLLFDGESLADAPAGPSTRPFAWVPQEAPLLADTLAVNVALGAPGADASRVLEGLGATALARSLDGARLGAGGRAVSGGERQWIALARAIATRQPVLLLDEPTSGLDAVAQQHVLDAIARLRGRRTVLIVTHRPEPLAIADLVVRIGADDLMERAA